MEVSFDNDTNESVEIDLGKNKKKKSNTEDTKIETHIGEKELISCLRNEKVVIKFVPRESGLITDPKHIQYGGLGINSKRKYVVPVNSSGVFINVLTNDEKNYLEYIMGLPKNALSVYLKENNYWTNRGVILGKENTVLDLSIPDDYIKYKILLANKDYIAKSETELKNNRKATYQYVIIKEGEEIQSSIESLNTTSEAYVVYGQLKDNLEILSLIVELATGRNIAHSNSQAVYAQVDKILKDNPKKFLEIAKDSYLDTKLLIKKAVETGYIRKRGQYYYLTEGNQPLCNNNQEPTLKSACEYLNAPKFQEIRFALEANIKS